MVVLLVAIFATTANVWAKEAVKSGDWNAADTWNPASIPADNDEIVIPSGFTVTSAGDIAISMSQCRISGELIVEGSFNPINTNITINSGGRLVVKSSMTSNRPIDNSGVLKVLGNLTCNANLKIGGGSRTIVAGNLFCDNCVVDSYGTLLVSGNVNTNSNFKVQGGNGHIAIGGNLTISSTLEIPNDGGTITVLGNVIVNGGSQNINGGVLTIVGDPDVIDPSKVQTKLSSSDVIINNTGEGLNVIFYENFDASPYKGSATGGTVTSNTLSNTGTENLVWISSPFLIGCNNKIKIGANVATTASSDVTIEYSANGAIWTNANASQQGTSDRYVSNEIPITGRLYIRITVNGLSVANSATIDEIIVQAFNTGGVSAEEISWVSGPKLDVCPVEVVEYKISNGNKYTNIEWYPTGGDKIDDGDGNNSTQTIQWNTTSNALLKVTLSGEFCNQPLSTTDYEYAITQSTDLSVGLTSLIHCCGETNNGSIEVIGKCGQDNNYTYSWTGPNSYTGSGTKIENLSPGKYTVTVSNEAGQSATADYVIRRTSLDLTNTKNFICNTDRGAFEYIISNASFDSPTVTIKKDGVEITSEDLQGLVQSSVIRFSSSAATNNYQMKLEVEYKEGMESDFSDVNFFTKDGAPLDFWIEEYSSSSNAVFWVELPQLATSNELIMDWGQTVTGQSDIDKVMIKGGGAVTTRWEGWIKAPAENAYYGIMSGTGTLTLSYNGATVTTTDNTGIQLTCPSSAFIKVVYEATSGNTSSLGYKTDESGTLGAIPNDNFYHRKNFATTLNGLSFSNRYNQLVAGEYTVEVSDGSCSLSKTFEVKNDTQDPKFATFPENYFEDIATFKNGNQTAYTAFEETFNATANLNKWERNPSEGRFSINSNDLQFIGNATVPEGEITYTFNGSFYKNLKVQLTAKQTGTGWTADDFIEILVDYNDGNGFQSLFIDKKVFNATADNAGESEDGTGTTDFKTTSDDISLETSADQKQNLKFRIKFHSGASDRKYIVSSFKIIGDQIGHEIPPTLSGEPTASDDTDEAPIITYVDSNPTWVCNDTEGYIVRTWTVTDHCGKVFSKVQKLAFGTRPVFSIFTQPDLTFDFCQNDNQTIEHPTATDACTTDAGGIEYSWVIKDQSSNILENGTGTGNIYSFAFPIGITSVITWRATDQSGAFVETTQNVIIRPTITATFTYDNVPYDPNICLNQNVKITISPTGGTGGYVYSNFSPEITGTAPEVYTTKLTGSLNKLTFSITDQVNTADKDGGCTVNLETQEFVVKELIGTGTITRE